jgi:hypothetical protein
MEMVLNAKNLEAKSKEEEYNRELTRLQDMMDTQAAANEAQIERFKSALTNEHQAALRREEAKRLAEESRRQSIQPGEVTERPGMIHNQSRSGRDRGGYRSGEETDDDEVGQQKEEYRKEINELKSRIKKMEVSRPLYKAVSISEVFP